MGTWAIPQTDEAVTRLEQLMASPVSASGAADALYPLVGDDTLFDMIGMAAESDPGADVRPLVAITLDDWANWMSDARFARPWEDGCRERVRALAQGYRGTTIEDLVMRVMVPDTAEGARAAYALLTGKHETAPQFDVAAIDVPGAYAVRETASGALSRLEVVFGVIAETDPAMAEALLEAHFPDAGSAPAP